MSSHMNSPAFRATPVAALLALVFLLGVTSIRHKTETYDEGAHMRYGVQLLQGSSDRFDDSKMPFSILNGIPWRIGEALQGDDTGRSGSSLFLQLNAARVPTILFSLIRQKVKN